MAKQFRMVSVNVVLVLIGLSGTAAAQTGNSAAASDVRREVREQVGASFNNAGLQNTLEVSWIKPTSRSGNPLLSDAHVAAGVTNAITPTQVRLGGWVEYSPLSILDLRAGVDPSAYFGTFDSLMGFSARDVAFDPDARKARGGATAGASVRTYLSPTLKFKAGPIVGSAGAEFEWWRSSADEKFFYEPTRDTLLKSGGDRMMATTGVLMYRWTTGDGAFSIGGLHNTARVTDASRQNVQRLGVIAIKDFGGVHFWMPRPRFTLIVSRYLDDPSKQGEWSAAAAVAFRKGAR